MKILRVGDPHVKVANIDESDALMSFVNDTALQHKVDRIELMGDLFHNHSILRLEVLEFWDNWLDTLSEAQELVVLVGNHDQSGDYNSHSNALNVFSRLKKKNLKIIQYPTAIGAFGYMPYIHDAAKFVELANGLKKDGAKVLVCHQTYNGSKFENGMYAPDGIDPESLSYQTILSGHIHAMQRYVTSKGQNVIYPGTARWDSNSDANQTKGIWLFEHDVDGNIVSETMIDTSGVCMPIVSLQWKEGENMPSFKEGSRTTIELVGSSAWIAQEKTKLKGKVGLKSKITDKSKTESRKAGTSLNDFLDNLFVTTMDRQSLKKYAKELGLV